MARRFQLLVVAIGGAASALPFLRYLLDVPANELGYETTSGAVGVLLLVSPYLLLAWLAQHSVPRVGYGALVLLLAGTTLVHAVASADAQGGFIAIYVIPLQWLAATLAGHPRFRRPAA